MGRRIDRAAGAALAATAMYLYFLNAWNSIPLACAAAFVGCVLLRVIARRFPRRPRMAPGAAREELLRIAALPDDEAARALETLIRGRYPDEDYRVVPALKHPEATLNSGDVLNLWKANRDAECIVIAATCACDPVATFYARELRSPAAAVVDSRVLTRMLRRRGPGSDMGPTPAVPLRLRLRRAFARVAARRPSPRSALAGAAMLALYLLGGSPLYLIGSLAVLFHFGAALIRFGPRRCLFQ